MCIKKVVQEWSGSKMDKLNSSNICESLFCSHTFMLNSVYFNLKLNPHWTHSLTRVPVYSVGSAFFFIFPSRRKKILEFIFLAINSQAARCFALDSPHHCIDCVLLRRRLFALVLLPLLRALLPLLQLLLLLLAHSTSTTLPTMHWCCHHLCCWCWQQCQHHQVFHWPNRSSN